MIDFAALRRPSRSGLVAAFYLLLALTVLAYVWWSGRPVQLPEVPDGKVQCISYNPPDSVPWEGKIIPLERIRADLEHLARYTRCVRTYSVDHGLDQVPQIARSLGLNVMLGIWIGVDKQHNDQEIERALELARTHSDVIQSLVVGNEVLLRREQTPAALSTYLQRVRAATQLPITYADVWEFWLRDAQLAQDVSFVTVHMLPYWEDVPVPIERAVPHIGQVLARVQKAFPRHRIFIGEAGWPSSGRQRAGAVPSLVNEARFFREFTAYAAANDVLYNFIEAFDQPWKRTLEGTVGGKWGLFDAQSQLKFPLIGPVQNDPDWHRPLVLALLAALAVIAALAWHWRQQRSTANAEIWRAIAVAAIAAYSGAALLVLQMRYLLAANRTSIEWLGSVAWFASGWCVYVCGTWLIVRGWREAESPRALPAAARAVDDFAARWHGGDGARAVLSVARLVFLFGLAYIGLLLTLDSRYRDFPVVAAVLPAAALWLHSLVSAHHRTIERPLEELLLCHWLTVASVWIALAEGFENLQSVAWCALNLWSALTLLWTDHRARDAERAAQQAHGRELNAI